MACQDCGLDAGHDPLCRQTGRIMRDMGDRITELEARLAEVTRERDAERAERLRLDKEYLKALAEMDEESARLRAERAKVERLRDAAEPVVKLITAKRSSPEPNAWTVGVHYAVFDSLGLALRDTETGGTDG